MNESGRQTTTWSRNATATSSAACSSSAVRGLEELFFVGGNRFGVQCGCQAICSSLLTNTEMLFITCTTERFEFVMKSNDENGGTVVPPQVSLKTSKKDHV